MYKLIHRLRRGWLLAVVALALFYRLWGISWGLPDRVDLNPDEHDYVLRHALAISFAHPDPGFLNYPSFLMYLISLAFGALRHLHLISGADWQAYLIGRLWCALFGAATILPAYKCAREFGGSQMSALMTSFWIAVLPLAVWESHAAVTDTLMTFWVTMTLWASLRLVRVSGWRDYAFAGACLGLATGSKYTAAVAVVAVITAALAGKAPIRVTMRGLAIAGVVSLACAFIVMPFSFIRFKDVLAAMSAEHQHVTGHHPGFSLPANGPQYHRYLYQLVAAWPFSMGIALYASVVAGTIWAATKLDRRMLVIFAFGLAYFGITGHWYFTPLRYSLPLIVVGAIMAGLWHGKLLEVQPRGLRIAAASLVLLTMAYSVIFTTQTTRRFAHETRVEAGRWLADNLERNSTVLVCGWSRYAALPGVHGLLQVEGGRDEGPVGKLGDYDLSGLIQLSSLNYDRHYRQGDTGWIHAYNNIRTNPDHYALIAKFDAPFINKEFYRKLDPMFGGYFVSPTIEFYRAVDFERIWAGNMQAVKRKKT